MRRKRNVKGRLQQIDNDKKRKKEEEARRKELEKRRKLKELEEEKEAEMERQRKKNNHEWDINCKGDYLKVNGQIVTGSAAGSIWIKGIVSEATHEWKFKTLN